MIIEQTDRDLWQNFDGIWDVNMIVDRIDENEDSVQMAVGEYLLSLRKRKVYCVGIDLKDYSGRSDSGQLILTSLLLLRQNMTESFMRQCGWITNIEPEIVIPTGDGAYVLFQDLQKAFGYIMTLNWQLHTVNSNLDGCIRLLTETNAGAPLLPMEPRYSLSGGTVFVIQQPDGRWNATGSAIVTCSRLLSLSSGTHFIVSDNCYHDVVVNCGLSGGEGAVESFLVNWLQNFSANNLGIRIVKGGQFPCWNISGEYTNANALIEIEQPSVSPLTIPIGDQDTESLRGLSEATPH